MDTNDEGTPRSVNVRIDFGSGRRIVELLNAASRMSHALTDALDKLDAAGPSAATEDDLPDWERDLLDFEPATPVDMAAEGLHVLPDRMGNTTMILVEGASERAIDAATGWCRGNGIDTASVPSGTPLVVGYGQIRYQEWAPDDHGCRYTANGERLQCPAHVPLIVPIPAEWMS